MKKAIFVIVALLAFAFSTVEAQTLVVSKAVVTGKQFRISAGDSTATISLYALAGQPFPLVAGQYPDSIRIRWYASADSLTNIYIYVKTAVANSGTYVRGTVLDSIKAATAVVSQGSHTISVATYLGYDKLKLALVAQATGNAYVATHASYTSVWLDFYYKMLGRP